ncbi:hypothetical protein [Lichenifustis flavocetrariae]|uniref:Uncharacterized protein n=1 Tax=Lichenifustis flavocetrariae TaxID=2949735 RepID=A0AA41Z2I5_9HYPH|nr:hypothetical protein [Lichenifustis flavocetrariae]MCW6513019.1 hypothetical protein [Lichenifustis flavocetrariae]
MSEADTQLLTFAGIVAVLGSAAAFLFTFNIYLIPLVVLVCAVATGIGMFGNHLRFKTRRSSDR